MCIIQIPVGELRVIERCISELKDNISIKSLEEARERLEKIEEYVAPIDRPAVERCLRIIEPARDVSEAVRLLEIWKYQIELSLGRRIIEECEQ